MKITKKIISVLLCIALVLSVSAVTVSAINETTVTYYIGDTVVKTVSEFVTAQHRPLYYAPDLRPDLVPANSYFTGWYLNSDCTGSPISPDGVYFSSEGLKLYAGFKQYESSFTPHYSTEGFEKFDKNRIQVFYPRMMGSTFVPNIQNTKGSKTTTTTDYEGDTVWRLLVSGASPYFFYDENAVAYQVKPGVSYKISFQYKYEFPATNTTEVFFEVGIGSKISNFTSDGKMTGDADSYKYRQRVEKIIPSKLGPTAKTNWETIELVLPALADADLETHYPILGFRTTHCSNEGLIDIKNVVVEEVETFVSFENYMNFSKNAILDETNNYVIAQNTAEHTVWENANNNGVWANPVRKEKIYTVFGGSGFAPENFQIVNGGMNSKKALKFKQTVSGTKFKVADISNGVLLKDNTTYTATFYYKAEGDSNKDLKFSVVNALNNEMLGMITSANTVVIPANQVANDWTKVVLTFTTDFGYHNADYAVSQEMFCIPVLCINSDIDDTDRTVYIDNVWLETSISCGGVSVLNAQAEAKEKSQALRVYFNYTPDQNGKITICGESVSVAKRGVLLAPATKLNNKTDKDGNFIRDMVETPNIFIKENASEYRFIVSEKTDNLAECWANENGELTYSTYIKNFEVNDENQIAVRGYIELSDGRVIYSDIYTYSVSEVKEFS